MGGIGAFSIRGRCGLFWIGVSCLRRLGLVRRRIRAGRFFILRFILPVYGDL